MYCCGDLGAPEEIPWGQENGRWNNYRGATLDVEEWIVFRLGREYAAIEGLILEAILWPLGPLAEYNVNGGCRATSLLQH